MDILQWVMKQTAKLADNVKDYKFYVKSQPNFVDSSTTLILTPFTNRDQLATVACNFKWLRIKNGLPNQVPQFRGNSYICQPSDIGCIIQAEVTSNDASHPGTAILKFGPVKLDVLIKKQVQHALTSRSATMNVDLFQKGEMKQCQLKISEDTIKISHCHSNNQYVFDYSMGDPRIQASIKQSNKVSILFNEKHYDEATQFTNKLFGFQQSQLNQAKSNQRKIDIVFGNRALKDNFLLIIKAFNTKKAMKTSSIISKIQNTDLSNDQNFNYILQIESLRADLVKLARLNDQFLNEKKVYFQEARRLQHQIQQIIMTYTKIAEGKCSRQELDKSVMELNVIHKSFVQRQKHSFLRQNQQNNEQNDILISNQMIMQQPVAGSRGGFIKKRSVPQIMINNHHKPFENILQDIHEQQIKSQPDQDKILLAKKLNETIIKNAKLQLKIKQLKQLKQLRQQKFNQSHIAFNLDNSQISNFSVESNKKMNRTQMQIKPQQKQGIFKQINQLRKQNNFLKQENQRIRNSSFMSNLDSKSVKSKAPSVCVSSTERVAKQNNTSNYIFNFQTQNKPQDNKSLQAIVQQLKAQNSHLRELVKKLTLQKQAILKQKNELQAKYRKKMMQNQDYKKSQDALNRSHNHSMEMEAYNEQKHKQLNQQNQKLLVENMKISKKVAKLKQQNAKLNSTINQLSGGKANMSMSSQGPINQSAFH